MTSTYHTDVLIIGAGVAGFAAAMAASYENKKVIIIDKSDSPGGESVNTNVGTLCGAYYRSDSKTPRFVGYPFCKSLLDELYIADAHAIPYQFTKGLYIIPYEWSVLKNIYTTWLNRAGVDVMLTTELEHINVADKNITSIQVKQNDDTLTIFTRSVVDCSGNAIVSQLAGIETIREENYQAASQIFRLHNISSDNEFSLTMAIKKAMVANRESQHWPQSYLALSVVPGSLHNNHVDLKLTLPETITDNVHDLEVLKNSIHKRIENIFNILQRDVKSLMNSHLDIIFQQLGIRVQQRSKGIYILTEQDVLQCHKFDTGIAVGTWPIEEWDNTGKLSMTYFDADAGYTIPADCLTSYTITNLFFAGKNISATKRAIASARVMGTCLQTGYVAGKLACIDHKEKQQKENCIASLRHELIF